MHSVAFGPVLHCVGHPACPGFPVVTTIDTVLAASQCCKKGFAQQVRAGGCLSIATANMPTKFMEC